MTADANSAYLEGLVREFCKGPHEIEWLEFKVNNKNPQEIGEYLSALANSAALAERNCALASISVSIGSQWMTSAS